MGHDPIPQLPPDMVSLLVLLPAQPQPAPFCLVLDNMFNCIQFNIKRRYFYFY